MSELFDLKPLEDSLVSPTVEVPEIIMGCLDNIKSTLPALYDHQHEDVLKAEKRFEQGKGYLFTNGTGVGKTFIGLGIAKRFYERDLKNILIVVPTDKKAVDWIEEGDIVGLSIFKIKDTNDPGINASVTTYANFYQNDELEKRVFDLVIYDESHYLMQNGNGSYTVYLQKHKRISNLPSYALEKAHDRAGMKPSRPTDVPHHIYPDDYTQDLEIWENKKKEIAEEIVKQTKVVFLSATPFAYHKSIQYGDGTLFEIEEKLDKEKQSYSYNTATGFDKFLQEHFGYRMKYNKITIPETGVDQSLLERTFFENHVEKGVMSTRILELPYDYSRDFITVDSKIGSLINEGMELFYSHEFRKEYKYLSEFIYRKYNYLFINQLLECIKAQEVHERISKHLSLGRKVVVFHSYNHSIVPHPFKFDAKDMLKDSEIRYLNVLMADISKFNKEFPYLVELDLDNLLNTRAAIKKHFPEAKEFNGTVPKKKRAKHIQEFNTDWSRTNVLLVQTKAGREGISLHDKTGNQQRVLINLGLPVAPTEAIQSEGRIYRSGLNSNAIYEYITVQTNFEKMAFAQKIAQRSRTAENLAMGNLARDLETAFKEGYINSDSIAPSLEQGVGGKEKDRSLQDISEFDKAKTFFWSRAKKNSKTKSSEGIDYYGTPEPLGMKMVEWLDPKPNERGLEPSAGHGAIARWFPKNTNNKFVEPSLSLSTELELNSTGEVIRDQYENHYWGNKYEFIAMNPPFGVGGKTAIEHLEKAVSQLYRYGRHTSRLLAIVPMGPATQKRIDNLFDEKLMNHFKLTGQLLLPACAFQRAGTSVFCKIMRIEKLTDDNCMTYKEVDLTNCRDIAEFFDKIEHLEF